MMAKIVLHIGSPKTATTTLQRVFFHRLHRKNNIHYIGKRSDLLHIKQSSKQELYYHNIYDKIMYSLLWGADFSKSLTAHARALNSIIDTHKINVLSEEALFHRDKIRGLIPFLERIQRLKALLAGHSVEVVCTLRKQTEYLYSRYVQNYESQWHYIKHNHTIETYYHNIISQLEERKLILYHIDTLRQYCQAFGKLHCLFFEEFLQDKFSYYQKIGNLLRLKITSADIPKRKLRTKQKTSKGYVTTYRSLPGYMVKNRKVPVILSRLIFAKLCSLAPRVISRIFLRYNIFLTKDQKNKLYQKLIKKLPRVLLNIFCRPILHPYFTKKQKRTIFELCRASNKKLATEGFCKEQDLKKYGYL